MMRIALAVPTASICGAVGGGFSFVSGTIVWLLFNWATSSTHHAMILTAGNLILLVSLFGPPFVGTLCAFLIALVLRQATVIAQQRERRVIAVGWILGFLVSETLGALGVAAGLVIAMASGLIGFAALNFFGGLIGFGLGVSVDWVAVLASVAIGGAVGGAIGSGVMFWQLRQAEKHLELSIVH